MTHPSRDIAADAPARVGSLIGGRSVQPRGARLPVVYPATGAQVSELIEADAAEVDAAVRAAAHAFAQSGWAGLALERFRGVRDDITLASVRDSLRFMYPALLERYLGGLAAAGLR